MKVVVQRCKQGSVSVDNKLINKIDSGIVLLVGFHINDTEEDLNYYCYWAIIIYFYKHFSSKYTIIGIYIFI